VCAERALFYAMNLPDQYHACRWPAPPAA
jgi:hypothetical protein